MTELEEITLSKETENELLKTQVQSLQAELMQLRGGNLSFDFTMQNVHNPNSLTGNSVLRNPFQNGKDSGQRNGQKSSPSASSGSITDSSALRSGLSSLVTSTENDVNKNATPNIDIPYDLFSNSSTGQVSFNINSNNNSNHQSPLFSTDLFGNSPAPSNNSTIFGQIQTQNTSPISDTFAATLASLTNGKSSPSLTNGFNTTITPSSSSFPLSSFTPRSTDQLFDMNDPLFNTWRDNSISNNGRGDDNSGFDIYETMFTSMTPGAFNLFDSTGFTEVITDSPITILPPQEQILTSNGEPAVSCPELREKLRNHPKFDDINIDQLCAEMRSKAKVCVPSRSAIPSRKWATQTWTPMRLLHEPLFFFPFRTTRLLIR